MYPSQDPDVLKSSHAILEYLKYCDTRQKPHTCKYKTFILKGLLEHRNCAEIPISEITQIFIESYLDHRFASGGGKTANRDMREIKTCCNWLLQRDYINTNPCKNIVQYKEDMFSKYVPPAEDIQAVLAVSNSMEADIIRVAYHSLARSGEIRQMKFSDCDFLTRSVKIYTAKRKGGSLEYDTISMNQSLYEILDRRYQQHLPKCDWIFPGENGQQLSRDSINKIMPRLCKKAEVKAFGLHSIRHHVAALLTTRLTLIEIQKVLRHKRATTTDIYLRSLIKIDTKGIHVLDELESQSVCNGDNIVPFNKIVNER